MPLLSVVVPHWPLDDEVDESLRQCLESLPTDCEKIVVVNAGTGFAVNVNLGLRVASGAYVAVVTNDSRVVTGDVYDLCVVGTVTSPLVLEKPGIDPNGFHGAFWVAPRDVLAHAGTTPIGSRRSRCFVSAKIALATAGAIGGVPGSPIPVGASALGTTCTSTSGISRIRSRG